MTEVLSELDPRRLPPLLLEPPWARPSANGPLRATELSEARRMLRRCRREYQLGRYNDVAKSAQELIVRIRHRLDGMADDDATARGSALAGSAATLVARTRRVLKGSADSRVAFEEAVGFFERAARRTELDPERLTDYGLALEGLGRAQEAIHVLGAAIEQGAKSGEVYRHLAELLFRQDDLDASFELVKVALRKDRDDAAARRLLAAVLERRGERAEAARHYEASGFAFARLGRFDDTLDAFDAAVRSGSRSPAVLAGRGDLLRIKGRPDEAVEPLERALDADPELTWAYPSLAAALYETGRLEAALDALDNVLERAPEYALAHALRGRVLRAVGRPEEAVEAFRRAVDLEPTLFRTNVELGLTLLALGEGNKALQALYAALRRAPDDPQILAAVGAALKAGGEISQAIEVFERAVDLNPGLVRAELGLAEALGEAGAEEQEAVDAMNRAIATSGETPGLLARKARVLANFDRLRGAELSLRTAIEQEPGNVAIRLDLARVLERLGRADEAIATLDHALEITPDDAPILRAKGRTLRALGRLSEAREVLEEAMALDPRPLELHVELARVCWRLCLNPPALEALDRVFARAPGHAEALALRAAIRVTEDDNESAHEDIARAIEIRATPFARAIEARVMLALGRATDALTALERGLSLIDLQSEEIDVEAVGELADVLRRVGRYEESLALLDQALEAAPDSPWLLGTKGQVLRQRGDDAGALALLVHAAEDEPSLVWAHAELGELYRIRRDYDPALKAFDAALRLCPTHRWALAGKGACLHSQQRYEEAVDMLAAALEQDRGETFAATRLAALLIEAGEFETAVSVLDGLQEDRSATGALEMRGWALENLGPERAADALATYRRVLERRPDSVWSIRGTAEALRALGDDEQAREAYERAVAVATAFEQVDASVLVATGRCCYALGDYDDAARIFTEALHVDPTMSETMMCLGLALMADGRCAMGIREYERARRYVDHENPVRRRGILEVASRDVAPEATMTSGSACAEDLGHARELVRDALEIARDEAAEDLRRIRARVETLCEAGAA